LIVWNRQHSFVVAACLAAVTLISFCCGTVCGPVVPGVALTKNDASLSSWLQYETPEENKDASEIGSRVEF
jgi:hypothetical protein